MSDDRRAKATRRRYRVEAEAGVEVTERCSSDSNVLHRLPRGTLVVRAEAQPDERGVERVRISSPAGWVEAQALEPAPPAASVRLDWATFEQSHRRRAPGDHYGLEFPFSLESLRAEGPDFLTAAFRAAGTLSQDNRVTQIVALDPLDVAGASENGFLTLAYERPEAGLHTELFVKTPPADAAFKFHVSAMSQGEVALMRRSRDGILPLPVAKYYFGDYCSQTTNYILITERVRFGVPPIEPAYTKGRDQHVPEVMEHYRVLAESLARLVAAHKTGVMGFDLEAEFPFARAARNFAPIGNPEARVDRLIDFVGRIAPQLFLPEATTPDFLRRWREDLLFGLAHKDEVIAYLHEDVDYTGLCHPNLNVDNAWYWRDASGELHAGLLDWGGAGQMSLAQALSSMLMMPDPATYLQLQREVIATFLRAYEEGSGRALDPQELTFQYKASVFSTAICTIVEIVVDLLFQFSEAEWKSMVDRFDPRLQEGGLASAVIWIDNMTRDWLDVLTPGEACRRIVADRH